MLTKALSLILVMFLGLALGLETARYVHAQATGVGGAVAAGTGGTSGTSAVNIHRALLGFSLLATSGALLLSFRGRGGLGVGAWLSRQWLRFAVWLELTLDGLFDFNAVKVEDGASALSESTRGLHLMKLYSHRFGQCASSAVRQEMDAIHRHSDGSLDWQASNAAILEHMERRLSEVRPLDDGLLPCRGCSWCGVDPSDPPDGLRTECDGSGRYLPSKEAERKRQLAQPKLPLQATPRPRPSHEGKQPDGVGPNETAEDVVRRHPDVLRIHQGTGDILVKNRGTGGVIVRTSPPDEPSST